MRVYKFGGASVKDAESIKNVINIINEKKSGGLFIVISAIGKTTNALEEIINLAFNNESYRNELFELTTFHKKLIGDLFFSLDRETHLISTEINHINDKLYLTIRNTEKDNYDFFYDQVVSFGEILSTKIISAYLNYKGIKNTFLDSREIITTDDNYRNANVNYKETENKIKKLSLTNDKIYITQGFIGGHKETTTTLGREGSDYSAALYSYFLNSENLTIWKDVDGILTADPRIFDDTIKLDEISYSEAIELAYFGAQVIHPKTIKPLENQIIPLYVKSFINYKSKGTKIHNIDKNIKLHPIFIIKENQILLSISPKDFSFIVEKNLSDIFKILSDFKITANLFQHSAISFSVCIDNTNKFDDLFETLSVKYKVKYNKNLQLVTIRHYNSQAIEKILKDKKILVQQKSRKTVRFVLQ